MTRKKPLHLDSPLTRAEAEWMRDVEAETTRKQVEYLKASTDTRKPIDSLNKVHLNALSEIARATYINRAAERRATLKDLPPEEAQQLDMWLI